MKTPANSHQLGPSDSTPRRARGKPPPAYRQRPGRTQALVTLTDSATGFRRDFSLGEFGSVESREAYHRIVAEWEANGRRLPRSRAVEPAAVRAGSMSIVELIAEYLRHAETVHHHKHLSCYKTALAVLRRHFGRLPTSSFGPTKLRAVREAMIREGGARRWYRKYVNMQVQRVRQLFKWAAAQELVPIQVYGALGTLEPLRRGRSAAPDNRRVEPVRDELLNAVRPLLNRPVRALVELQLLTGARPGELLGLRPCDLEMNDHDQVWLYRPEQHKNAFREQERVIVFGPRAQEILRPFLRDRALTACMFSPQEADAARREAMHKARVTREGQGNGPGTNRREFPKRAPGDCYTTASYYRSILYACDKAFPLGSELRRMRRESHTAWAARLGERWAEVVSWRRGHRFHPHQLRHNAATLLRREFGLEAAQLTLGHSSARVTDAIYAQRDREKIIEIMRKIG
ncbi:MAG: site-specific integrase [Phycisphaerae bacterium]